MPCSSTKPISPTTSAAFRLDDAVLGELLDELLAEPGGIVGLAHQVVVGHAREEMMVLSGEVLPLLELLPLQRDVPVLLVLLHRLEQDAKHVPFDLLRV